MGITGLLPILKPIQKQKHLSELAGQTLGIDGYVWLHRGSYGCASDLATGKRTTKYVDFAMSRVRLLRHHNIMPYVVFDGGPLPAKGKTEEERAKKRAEHLEKADALLRQKRYAEAREHHVKCVDVTPQMAYQLIKALKVENIPYVVAPYEADAQLAFLERVGLIDGIVTEDSDLLVFGCQNVYFKLDTVSSTLISISRRDFGSPALASESLSFVGWSDSQFRWMAMLSGCDYLPSIPGVGLKTAWTLLKKHKSVEKVIRAIKLEGKKNVPSGYTQAFMLAEKVFLHQRVYDPSSERLAYLNDVPAGERLDVAAESYVGSDLAPPVAKGIAEGSICPISKRAMEDINPLYLAPSLKGTPLASKDQNSRINRTPSRGKGKGKEKSPGGLLNFFAPVSKQPVRHSGTVSAPKAPAIIAGKASGKRTLVDVMDETIAKGKESRGRKVAADDTSHSRFFSTLSADPNQTENIAGPSNSQSFNDPKLIEDDIEDFQVDTVIQEQGYLSPSPSMTRLLTPDFSSPIAVRSMAAADSVEHEAANLSNSLASNRMQSHTIPSGSVIPARVIVLDSSPIRHPGPDLEDTFSDCSDNISDILCWDGDSGTPSSAEAPLTPSEPADADELDEEDLFDSEDKFDATQRAAQVKVLAGWRARFSYSSSSLPATQISRKSPERLESILKRRRSTAFTPRAGAHHVRPKRRKSGLQSPDMRAHGQDSLTTGEDPRGDEVEILESTTCRLQGYRYIP